MAHPFNLHSYFALNLQENESKGYTFFHQFLNQVFKSSFYATVLQNDQKIGSNFKEGCIFFSLTPPPPRGGDGQITGWGEK